MDTLKHHSMAWTSDGLHGTGARPLYVLQVDEQGVSEVEDALNSFKRRGLAVVRGLDPRKYSDKDNVTIFLGIANYIGDQRGLQDKKGSMLNVLALHVRSLAETGGNTFVASSWTIYNESGNPPRYITAPLLHVSENKIVISFDPGRLGLHPATAKTGQGSPVPALTSTQLEALEVLSKLASKHRHCLDTKQGDMIFINNLSLLHARDAYTDPKEGPGRHFVRLWLRNPELAWNIPQAMRTPWEAAYGSEGKGFPGLEKNYPVHPTLKYKPPKYTAGSAAFVLEDSEDVNGEGST
ncbi:hypothetical protein N0V88_002183 [Collariella sp. IMI 366227]|nr:hypothetical protein N0V88_002183 [Collariella sp. IMI 366227]